MGAGIKPRFTPSDHFSRKSVCEKQSLKKKKKIKS